MKRASLTTKTTMNQIKNPEIGGDLATVGGEKELAELEAYLDQGKTTDADPKGKLAALREATRSYGRAIVLNTAPSQERINALNDLQRVFTYAKTAAFR